ncbi:MAG TPA: threonine--tRNA ligase [Candidatus Micrarchaeia archaeon]|nr:threonine--tRNA ligase [Candidatus Micrarchaeia archaeon]
MADLHDQPRADLGAGTPAESEAGAAALDTLRHSTAHLMAAAVVELFPGTEYAIGPPIQDGFYYDFLLPAERRLSPDDLPQVEARMRAIAARRPPFERVELSRQEALAEFRRRGQRFKVEILEAIPDGETITCYRTGDFLDLCRGPHLADAGAIPVFRLLHPAGAYWRGDERNPMLQRLYGTAWFSAAAQDEHLRRLAEAERRDHRRLGRELELYSIEEAMGQGLILWHPRGAAIRELIEDHWRRAHRQAGYQLVYSPHVAKEELWETSHHLQFFADDMWGAVEMEGARYRLKPMNCPFHILIYGSRTRSYRELPLRLGELGTVYRNERSGVLHGLLRVRGFTQDDAHIFCTEDQVADEVDKVVGFSRAMLRTFGFEDLAITLGTRPEKAAGAAADWDRAEGILADTLGRHGLRHRVDRGGGAFYGPKIDISVRDALGRAWQCATIQFDFTNPENFGLTYVGADGAGHRPVMVHRTLLGSMERFLGVLIEHYAGAFPVWLAPVQVQLITVSDDQLPFARQAAARLRQAGIRVEVPDRPGERMQAKIRDGERQKVPYLGVIGPREAIADLVHLRDTRSKVQAPTTLEALVDRLRAEGRPPEIPV